MHSLPLVIGLLLNSSVVNGYANSGNYCSCFANSAEHTGNCNWDMEKEAAGTYNNTVESCFSWLNEDGSFQCHWGPEEVYDCWDEGYEHVQRLERCACTTNTEYRRKDCEPESGPLTLPQCMAQKDGHGNIACHWGPGHYDECIFQEKRYLEQTNSTFGDDYVDKTTPTCKCSPIDSADQEGCGSLGIEGCLLTLNEEGEQLCKWGPSNTAEC